MVCAWVGALLLLPAVPTVRAARWPVPQDAQVYSYRVVAELPIFGDRELGTARWRVEGMPGGMKSNFTVRRGDSFLSSLMAPRYTIRSKNYVGPGGVRLAIYAYESAGGEGFSFSFRSPARGPVSGICIERKRPVPCHLPDAMDAMGLFAKLAELMHTERLQDRIPARVFYRNAQQKIVLRKTADVRLGGVDASRHEVVGMGSLFNLDGVRVFVSLRKHSPHELQQVLITGLAADLRIERTD
jgi:hypothetical protein